MAPEKDVIISTQIGNGIKAHREKKFPGWGGRRRCAKEFGVGENNWGDWEAGRKVPSDSNQRKLAEFFGVSLAELRGDDDMASPITPSMDVERGKRFAVKAAAMFPESSQAALAHFLGISPATYRRCVAGHTIPLVALRRMSENGVDINDLVRGDPVDDGDVSERPLGRPHELSETDKSGNRPQSIKEQAVEVLRGHVAMAQSMAKDYEELWHGEEKRREAAEARIRELERQNEELKAELAKRGRR